MPDEGSGNNDDGDQKVAVLDSAEVKEAIEAAVKEAKDESYRKGQSDQNKATQVALDAAKTAQDKIDVLEKSQFDSLSDEDKQKRMVETLYKERNLGKGDSSEQQDGPDSDDNAKSDAEKARTKLEEAVKAEGIDPADVDMDNGSAKFIQSLLKAREAKDSQGEDGEDNTEGKDSKEKDPNGGPVDQGGGGAPMKDIKKANTYDIFANAYKGGS